MRENRFDWMRKCQFPLLIASAGMPPVLLAFAVLAPEHMLLAWAIPAAFVVLAEISLLIPGKWRLLYGFLAALLLAVVGVQVSAAAGSPWINAVNVLYLPALFMCLPMAGWQWQEEPSLMISYFGIGMFLFVQFLAEMLTEAFPDAPELIQSGLTISFLIFALLVLLSLNRITLNRASAWRHKASTNIRQKNRMMVIFFFLLITLLVITPVLVDALKWLIGALLRLFQKTDTPQPTIPQGTVGNDSGGIGNMGGETSMFAKVMEVIFQVLVDIVMALAIPALIIALLMRIPKFARWMKKLFGAVGRFAAAVGEDYEEEITDIRDRDSLGKTRFSNGRRIHLAEELRMTPRQKIRHRYGKLLRKHPDWADSTTARENLPEQTASYYERARYSNDTMTEEDARQFASEIKRI